MHNDYKVSTLIKSGRILIILNINNQLESNWSYVPLSLIIYEYPDGAVLIHFITTFHLLYNHCSASSFHSEMFSLSSSMIDLTSLNPFSSRSSIFSNALARAFSAI